MYVHSHTLTVIRVLILLRKYTFLSGSISGKNMLNSQKNMVLLIWKHPKDPQQHVKGLNTQDNGRSLDSRLLPLPPKFYS